MPNASQRLTKRAALSAESFSRMPPRCFGWLATIPTGRPPIRARQVMIVRAQRGFRSKHSPSSTMRAITSYMSYGLARRVGQDVEQLLVRRGRPGRRPRAAAAAPRSSAGRRRGSRLIACDALLVGADLEVADAGDPGVDARAAQLLLGDVLAGHRLREVRAGQRHRAAALHHRHEVGQPGDVRGARRAGAHQRRHLRDHAAHRSTSSRNRWPGAGEQRARGLLDARAGRVEQPDHRDALAERELAQARRPSVSPVMPIEPAMTVKS